MEKTRPTAEKHLALYEVESKIGKGSFGEVFKIRKRADNHPYVWKKLNYGTMRDKEKQQLVSEVNILRDMAQPNVVKYVDRIIDKENQCIYIVMEFCENGDLQYLIKNAKRRGKTIDEPLAWKILAQLVDALNYCH